MSALLPRLIDDLHRFIEQDIPAERAVEQALRWRLALIDFYRMTGEVAALVGIGFLMRHQAKDPEAERVFLKRVHAHHPAAFWRAIQRVYRFAVPLAELNALVGACRVMPVNSDGADLSGKRLCYFPAYTNKYQELLYWQPTRQGLATEKFATVDALSQLQPKSGAENILHLHWMNAVFDDPAVPFEDASRAFLALVAAKQRAGFKVYWTVHNRLNHDSRQPDEEQRFRTALARLVDRVYLHHPLLRYELDWLPPEVEPWLCEHGPYIELAHGGIDRVLARKRLEIDEEARVFLWFGQIRPYKGLLDWLPAILNTLANRRNARLLVAGKGMAPDVRQIIADYPAQVVYINRHVSAVELRHLAAAADFGVLTYRDILTSGAMFHMYCMGLPVIAPDMGSLPAYVVPGWNGALYRDTASLDQTLRMACRADAARLAEYRKAAWQTAATFRWGRVV